MKRLVVMALTFGLAGCPDLVPPTVTLDAVPDVSADVPPDSGSCSTGQDCVDPPGKCHEGVCTAGACSYVVKPNACLIDGACFELGQQAPDAPCLVCTPGESQDAFVAKSCGQDRACDPISGGCIPVGLVGPGEPCVSGADCLGSALCVPTAEGFVCSATCDNDSDCPSGLACDAEGSCTDAEAMLCKPCNLDIECGGPGIQGARCLSYPNGIGSFCGTACSGPTDCSEGYVCLDLDGQGTQCVPALETCECSPRFIAERASTGCGDGVCNGTRTCEADGLSECVGAAAQLEVCDGLDNDCDGSIDEDWKDDVGLYVSDEHCGSCGVSCSDAVPNGAATCQIQGGTASCVFTECLPGYVQGAQGCIPDTSKGCEPCATSSDCTAGLSCEPIGDGSFCVASCADGGTPCPTGFECVVEGVGAGQCLLESGGCAVSGSACETANDCEDLDSCTTSTCEDGVCDINPLDCSALTSTCGVGVCSDGSCSLAALEPDGALCDDGDSCTTSDSCEGGTCGGTLIDCSALDGSCVEGACQEGSCVGVALPCGVTSARVHFPGAGGAVAPGPGATIGYCGSFGVGVAGTSSSATGFSVELGFTPGGIEP